MPSRSRFAPVAVALVAGLAACRVSTSIAPAELLTDLTFTSVLATPPMRDTARVAGAQGSVAVIGLLNQTAPCFSLASSALKDGERIALRLTATETAGTCNTFAAGAFDYNVSVRGIAPGGYDVDVLHRVAFKDGRVVEATVGAKRVEVR